MADGIAKDFWKHALGLACPVGHTYKLALFAEELTQDAVYDASKEIVGHGYQPGGATLSGLRVEADEAGVARLCFDKRVEWLNAEIAARSALIYDATANVPLRIIDFGRRVGVSGGLFEVLLSDAGVLHLGDYSGDSTNE